MINSGNNNDNTANEINSKSNEHDNDEKTNVIKADLSTLPVAPGVFQFQ